MKKLLLVLICLLPIVAYAQSGKVFTVERDLSNSMINVIYQDKSGFIWIGTDDGLNCYDGAKFRKFKHSNNIPNSLIDNNILSLGEAPLGNMIIGTTRGLMVYNKATEIFRNIPFGYRNEKNMRAYISAILVRKNGDILIGTSGHGLYQLVIDGNNCSIRKSKFNIKSEYITGLFEDKDKNLWIATVDGEIIQVKHGRNNYYQVAGNGKSGQVNGFYQDSYSNIYVTSRDFGFAKLDKKSKSFVVPVSWKDRIPVYDIVQIDNKRLYVCTIGHGVQNYDINSGKVSDSKIKFNTFNFGNSEVRTMLKDSFGNLWIGVYGTGVVLLPKETGQFKYMGPRSINHDNIGSSRIVSIFKDNANSLWLGTANDGLYKVSENGLPRHYTPSRMGETVPPFISGIFQDSNHSFWLFSIVDGLFRFNPSNGTCSKVPLYFKNKEVKSVTAIAEDKKKDIWIGMMGGGLMRWDMHTNKLYPVKTFGGENDYTERGNALHNRWVSALYYSRMNKLYIGTCDGLGCLDLNTMNFVSLYKKNRIFAGIIINVIHEDNVGNLWIGTPNGLICLNEKTGKYKIFTMHDGLPSDAICAIQNDNKKGLWISTDYGLSHYNAVNHKFVNYYSSDGLQSNEFSSCSSFADSKGNLYFGGTEGVTYFNVSYQNVAAKKPIIKLVGLYLGDKSVSASMKSGMFTITDKAVYESDRFDLSHNDNNITLEFSAMDFYNAERITYAYSINNGPWHVQRAGVNRVTFNNMSPGTYHFRIKSMDSDTSSDIRSITIVIHHAWYASWWAVMIYIILLLIAINRGLAYVKDRYRRKRKLEKIQQTEKINEAKLQFFINIAHEIRTPMTLIISPLNQLMANDKDDERQKSYSTINRSAQRILRLVNQLMDIRKIDKGQMTLRFSENDIIKLINDISGDFAQQMQLKNITFDFHHQMDALDLWVDRGNFDKIIVNILSNALKFTPNNGHIDIFVEKKDMAEITISNSGLAIDSAEIEKIFERFYQIHNSLNNSNIGTGIGLHLTRSLVQLHHGDIHAENNTSGSGCRFIIRLPLGNKHLREDEMDRNAEPLPGKMEVSVPEIFVDEEKSRRRTKHYVLVVEDDEEIRKYICAQLRPSFNTQESCNGREAYRMILANSPDLVISDIMMPEMDGFELCRKIKLNPNTNSIPVILLTAKTTMEDNLEGLERGADAYITKPFNISILKKTVESLINNREVLRNNFTGKQDQEDKITKLTAKSPDDKLMERIMKVIDSNLSNPELNVEMITREVGISRVHLYRKMKELTNQSMRDFIRNVRLKQAATLLSEKKYSVSEVADMTGFPRVSNFSTLFKNQYGISPLAYRDAKDNSKSAEESEDESDALTRTE